MKILNRIRTYLFAAEMFVSIALTIVLMFFFRRHTLGIRRTWARLQLWLLGCRIEIIGEPDSTATLVLANHQSMLDIIVMLGYHPADLAFVAKREIGDLFFFGQTVKLTRMILIDRKDPRALARMVADARERVAAGRTIFVFPEGTRGSGERLAAFKSGSRLMAERLGMRVQPAVLINTRAVLDSQKFVLGSGRAWVKIIYLPAVQASKNGEWFGEIERAMNAVYDAEMGGIAGGANASGAAGGASGADGADGAKSNLNSNSNLANPTATNNAENKNAENAQNAATTNAANNAPNTEKTPNAENPAPTPPAQP